MKKIMFMFLCALSLVSCEQEENWSELQVESNKNESYLTRSASDTPTALEQLDGVPVYIKSVYSNKYLSAISNDGDVGLVDKDDGSLRQRWLIERYPLISVYPYNVSLLGGININNPKLAVGSFKGRYTPFVDESVILGGGSFNFVENSIYNYSFTTIPEKIDGGFPFPGEMIDPMKANIYIQPKSLNGSEIEVADNYYKGDKTKWDIIPVDEFRVEEITYDLTTSDQLVVIPTQIANKTFVNDTDISATRVISFQETITNESSFSETEGLKVTVSTSTSAKVGIAGFFEGSFSGEVSNEKSWSYTVGSKETKSYTISESITQEIPPRTTIRAELIATKYDANLTYVAKMYGVNTGKTIYLKGKWKGAVIQESKIVLTQENKILKTIKVTPE